MSRTVGSKNRVKSPIFAFKSIEDRAWFVRNELSPDAEYTVYSQSSLFKSGLVWFYLSINMPEASVQNPEKVSLA